MITKYLQLHPPLFKHYEKLLEKNKGEENRGKMAKENE